MISLLKLNLLLKKIIIIPLILILFSPISAYSKKKINVHVSILPIKYFVNKIGADHVVINLLLNPGENPVTYMPSPNQIKNLTQADLFFRIGVPFEAAIFNRVQSISKSIIIDLSKGINLRQIKNHVDHTHEAVHTHSNKKTSPESKRDKNQLGLDPHCWMDPENVKLIANTIFQALTVVDPNNQNDYERNYNQFLNELDQLDNDLELLLKPFQGKNLFVFHPSFGYFTDAYGLNQIAIETMGKAPKGKILSRIIKLVRKEQAKIIFAQPQFDQTTANKIASSIDGTVVTIDPLAYDYLQNMKLIGKTISHALGPK